MDIIRRGDSGPAVADIQGKLAALGLLSADACTGVFDEATEQAVRDFNGSHGLPDSGEVDEKAWAALLDASFELGDRTLYLRMPFFHGNDVRQL